MSPPRLGQGDRTTHEKRKRLEKMKGWRLLMVGVGLSAAAGCASHGLVVKSESGKAFFVKERIPVSVRVDFGPLGKPPFEESALVTRGSTPKDAVSVFYPLKSGMVCCDTREVAEIDGVPIDAAKGRWWMVRVNGDSNVSPFHTQLKPGDRVEWVYTERSP